MASRGLTDLAIRNLKGVHSPARDTRPWRSLCRNPTVRPARLRREVSLQWCAQEADAAGGVTLAQARKLAADAVYAVAQGNDPATAKKSAQATAAAAAANTVEAVCREYLRREGGKAPNTGRDRELVLGRLVYPILGGQAG